MFDYLDKNRDGFVSYSEFCFLCEEKRRNIDPFDSTSSAINKSVTQGVMSLGQEDELDKLERMSMASNFYQGFKSKKLKSKHPQNAASHAFGVTSLPSDSISKIMTHQFEKDFNDKIQTKFDREREIFQAIFTKR